MIPFFFFSQVTIGPLTIHVWGLFVALGIIAGTLVAVRRANKHGIPSETIFNLVFWLVLGAFIGGKVVFLLFHGGISQITHSDQLLSGFSSLGAIVTAVAVSYVFIHRAKISVKLLLYIFGPALLLVDAVGRIGCFLIHEHLGRATHFFLAVNINGTARHDLGLYFALTSFVGFLVVLVFGRSEKYQIDTIGYVSLCWYFMARFFLEFLYENGGRFGVQKFFGLTVMQHLSLVAIIVVVTLMFQKVFNKKPR